MAISTRFKLMILAVAATVALLVAAVLLQQQSGADRDGRQGGRDDGGQKAVTSDIWKVGHAWTVKVTQNDGLIRPHMDEGHTYTTAFRFEVEKAPTKRTGEWLVSAVEDGAEGPWANGYELYYRLGKDGAFHLTRLGPAGKRTADASYARGVVGDVFPLQVKIGETPKSYSQKGLVKQGSGTALPPPPPPAG